MRGPIRAVWIELGANLTTLSDPAKLAKMLERIKSAGFNTVIIEAKNAAGFSAYPSQYTPHISSSTAPRKSLFNPYDAPANWLPQNYDILKSLIDLSREHGLSVWAAINIFSEGINLWKDGAAYQPGFNKQWLAIAYAPSRNIIAPDGAQLSIVASNIGRTIFGIATGRIPDNAVIYSTTPPPISKWTVDWALDGMEVVVAADKNEKLFVKEFVDWKDLVGKPYQLLIPGGGFILSVHGAAKAWVTKHLKPGDPVTLSKLEKKLVPSTETGIFAFTNPLHPEVRQRALAIIREILTNYRVDGIVLDRIRYGGANMDFSAETRKAFESYLGKQIANWPAFVLDYGSTPSWYTQIPGRFFPQWVSFRAFAIQSFIKEARELIKTLNPKIILSIYVGGWYPIYYEESTNWGSRYFNANYWWTDKEWPKAGVAELLDYLFVGLYYRNVTIKEARSRPIADPDWASLEGGIPVAKAAVMNATRIIGSINLTDYEEKPYEIPHALDAIRRGMSNAMVFDVVYLDAWSLWKEVSQAFSKP
jgi:uncharacterized lipoprotein YddW (UPF0748 family)